MSDSSEEPFVCVECGSTLNWPFFWTFKNDTHLCPACFELADSRNAIYARRGTCTTLDCTRFTAPRTLADRCRLHYAKDGINDHGCVRCRPLHADRPATYQCQRCRYATRVREHRDYKRMGRVDELTAKLAALAEFESLGYSYERLAHLVSLGEIADDCERADYVHDDGDI